MSHHAVAPLHHAAWPCRCSNTEKTNQTGFYFSTSMVIWGGLGNTSLLLHTWPLGSRSSLTKMSVVLMVNYNSWVYLSNSPYQPPTKKWINKIKSRNHIPATNSCILIDRSIWIKQHHLWSLKWKSPGEILCWQQAAPWIFIKQCESVRMSSAFWIQKIRVNLTEAISLCRLQIWEMALLSVPITAWRHLWHRARSLNAH